MGNAEKAIVDALAMGFVSQLFPSTRFVTVLPDQFEDSLPIARVTGLGGPETNFIAADRVIVDCFADTRDAARLFASEVKGFLIFRARGQFGGVNISRITCPATPHYLPYPNTKPVHLQTSTYVVFSKDLDPLVA